MVFRLLLSKAGSSDLVQAGLGLIVWHRMMLNSR